MRLHVAVTQGFEALKSKGGHIVTFRGRTSSIKLTIAARRCILIVKQVDHLGKE